MSQNSKQKLEFLLKQWMTGLATEEQVFRLVELLKLHHDEEEMVNILASISQQLPPYDQYKAYEVDEMIDRILQKSPAKLVPLYRRVMPWVAAASIILIAVFLWVFIPRRQQKPVAIDNHFSNNIQPGRDGAILTLSSGKQIVLDSTKGNVANEGGMAVINKYGSISYAPLKGSSGGVQPQAVYNTVATPKGRQYQLTLQDGSKVWLNAASSIHFPTAFIGNERIVEITGEAYFEVAHNASKPFKVKKGNVEVTVLGTHFNVNAYDDEDALKVTLLEGSVKVSQLTANSQKLTAIIKPGQQAVVKPNSPITTGNSPDLDVVMAWKNGRFRFEGANIQSIMRQLSRWYNVDIEYKDNVPYSFVANVSRDVPVSQLLKLLELTNLVHFKIEGQKIIVMK